MASRGLRTVSIGYKIVSKRDSLLQSKAKKGKDVIEEI